METVGLMAIDDLTVAIHPSTVLAGNIFPNPTFEGGDQLDNPTGALPAGIWSRGGSDGSIDQVSTNNSVSPIHSLALVDNNENGYGEWYGFLTLTGVVPGDSLDLQWFQLYSVTNGSMRLTFAFTDANNTQLQSQDFSVSGDSPGWQGTAASSTFDKQNQRLLVPEGTVKLRVNLASGGASTVTGIMLIDDLSVKIASGITITAFASTSGGFNLTWDSVSGATYTVQFSTDLVSWDSLATSLPATDSSTTFLDTAVHNGNHGFYRIMQE